MSCRSALEILELNPQPRRISHPFRPQSLPGASVRRGVRARLRVTRFLARGAKQATWEESLVVTGTDPAQVEDVDDDLARELAFYNQVCRTINSPAQHAWRMTCFA